MHVRAISRAAAAALLALLPSAAPAATPSLLWSGADTLSVSCLVHSRTTSEAADFGRRLCDKVRAMAGHGAPVPVAAVEHGDPAFVRPASVVLLVHASVERSGEARTVAFTIRPWRPSGGAAESFYGTAPRAIAAPASELGGPLEAALAEAVAEILPWQQEARPAARPLPR